MKKQNLINENKTFTFKYDPTINLEGTFFRMNEAMRTGKPYIQRDCSIVNSIEAIYRSMTKARLKLFQCLADEQPQSLYQLAQLLKRDYAGVWRDAKALELNGVIKTKKKFNDLEKSLLAEKDKFSQAEDYFQQKEINNSCLASIF